MTTNIKGNIKGVRTELPTKEFRWHYEELQQKITVIQHNADGVRDIGIYEEWQSVIVDNKSVSQI